MKMFVPIVFFLSLLSFTACLDDYNKSTKHPVEYSHEYHDHSHDGHSHSHEMGSSSLLSGDIYGDKNRNAWQKTDVIRYHLGDSKDKIIADIGAGPYGYFTFDFAQNANFKKILAIDIDQEALDFIDQEKSKILSNKTSEIETRLVEPDNPKLNAGEVDVVLIANTLIYIEDRLAYLVNLKKAIKKGGRLVIVDYKMKDIPPSFPAREERMPLYVMEELAAEAGFQRVISDDFSLPYQYVVVCENK